MTSTPPDNSSWDYFRKKYLLMYMEHVYRSEDTLFQVLYDRKFRPEIYQLKRENREQRSSAAY